MYAVSEEFKTAIKSSNRTSSIYGTLTTSDGTQYPLNDSNMIKDSLYITNQIVNDKKMNLNSVIRLHFQKTDLSNLKADYQRYVWICRNAGLITDYGDKYLTPIERAVLKMVMGPSQYRDEFFGED